jgi:hypothetical protein
MFGINHWQPHCEETPTPTLPRKRERGFYLSRCESLRIHLRTDGALYPFPLPLAGEGQGGGSRRGGSANDFDGFAEHHALNPPEMVGTSSGLKP